MKSANHPVCAEICGDELIIRLKIEDEFKPSSTGKTLIVASTNGTRLTEPTIKGQKLRVTATAFIYPNG